MRGAVALLLLTGCLRSTQFACDLDTDCGDGHCESVGFCSFTDSTCASGSRFGALSGSFANQCVGDQVVDAGIDSNIDAPPCSGYAPLSGAPHLYRFNAGAASWDVQRTACAAEGAYLAIPDDVAELTAFNTLAGGAVYWVGISDQATENSFLTVLGVPAVFLPWDTGEPNNSPGGADCAKAKSNLAFEDDRCASGFAAVCECEPP